LGGRYEDFARGNMIMRTMLAILAFLAAGTAAIAGSASPVSYDYPWCVMGGELGYSGDCSYQTRAQCLASASGRWNLYCDVNWRLLFERQQVVEQQGVQQRRGRRRDY
jgi:hypothetical protein